MGIVEVIRQRQIKALREEYTEKGIERGIEKGKEEVVKNLLNTNKFTVSEIANFTGVTEGIVRKITKALK